MRTLVHLSDLHFGRVDAEVLEPLAAAVWQIRPDLTVVSGDFTQGGTEREFAEARRFLHKLPNPQLVVPGNHDMPFFNPLRRFLLGLTLYRKYISDDLEPYFADGELVVMGVNTARAHTFRGGSIRWNQIRRIEQKMCPWHGAGVVRFLVTHHPFDLPESFSARLLVRNARNALERLTGCVDVLLAGHMHVSHIGHIAVRYKIEGQSAIFVHAGTATSTRGRGEPNAFNLIRVDYPVLDVERFVWSDEHSRFASTIVDRFTLTPEGWARTWHDPVRTTSTDTEELSRLLETRESQDTRS